MSILFKPRERLRAPDDDPTVTIGGIELPVTLKRNAKAKRIILRLNKTSDGITLTVPRGASEAEALRFAISQEEWIAKRLSARPQAVPFADGAVIPVRGDNHRIEHLPERRGTVWLDDGEPGLPRLCVAGDEAHIARRTREWLKREARGDLKACCAHYADVMGLRYKRVDLRDQTTRWGSCSSSGVLSFSWRLILAPHHVLDYVAAHEVAHLKEMNHSKRFWALVEDALPTMKTSRKWLKAHGAKLHLYGPGR